VTETWLSFSIKKIKHVLPPYLIWASYSQVAKVCPDSVAEAQFDAPTVTSVVFDGAVVVQMVTPDIATTFGKHAH